MRVSFNQRELFQNTNRDMDNLFDFLDKRGVLTTSELVKINQDLKTKYAKQFQKGNNVSTKIYNLIECTTLALEMCELLKVNDTSKFSRKMITNDFIEKIINHKKHQELLRNEKVKETNTGYQTYLYQGNMQEPSREK